MATSPKLIKVFYSYAYEDEIFCKELEKHLALLQRQGLIVGWHNRLIDPGTNRANEIDAHLDTSHIILLLISASFLASDYCYSFEMKRALERHNSGKARLIPIILRPVDWKEEPLLNKFQVLPTDGKPVITWSMPPTYDEAFLDIAQGIRKVVKTLVSDNNEKNIVSQPSLNMLNIPHRRNPFFTGRDKTLKLLHDNFNATQTRFLSTSQAISGLGGIGKTQIAVEYVYRYRDEYDTILWISAATRDTLFSGFTVLESLLHLLEKEEKDQTLVVNVVKQWLANHEKWLLVLDNADDLNLVRDFLPNGNNGHILLTTRAQAVGWIARGIEIEKMSEEEGTLLLLRRSKLEPTDINRSKAQDVVVAMDGLPLALDQAGAYIEETGCSLSAYLDSYRIRQATLLKRRGGFGSDHPEPVATTWSLSFEQIERDNPAAADLLRICAFLSPDAIPEEIFIRGASDLGVHFVSFASEPSLLDEAIGTLRGFSLLKRNTDTNTLSVHQLVQAVLKESTNEYIKQMWAERIVRALNRSFPDIRYQTWTLCQRYIPHALACALLIRQYNFLFAEAAQFLDHMSFYLRDQADYAVAEPLFIQALTISEQVLGPEHSITADILNHLAQLYHTKGEYEKAEPLYQRALLIREQIFRSDSLNIDITQTLDNLAEFYRRRAKYDKAEPLLRRALLIREQILGSEHPDTAECFDSLARLYYVQAQYILAENLYLQALSIREKVLGAEHHYTADSLSNLAVLYHAQGMYEKAEPLYQRVLAIQEKKGVEHPDTANTLDCLARIFQVQGKYTNQIESLYQRALSIREKALGLDHPYTAISLQGLASFFYDQGQFEKAESLYQKVLAIHEKKLGSEHPDIAVSLDSLASIHRVKGQIAQAELLYQRALALREKALGAEHPNVANSLNNLALFYRDQGQFEKAETLYQRTLMIREKVLGYEHSSLPTFLDEYADLLVLMKQEATAVRLKDRANLIRAKQTLNGKSR